MADLEADRWRCAFDPTLTAIVQVPGYAVRARGVFAPLLLAALGDVPLTAETGLTDFSQTNLEYHRHPCAHTRPTTRLGALGTVT